MLNINTNLQKGKKKQFAYKIKYLIKAYYSNIIIFSQQKTSSFIGLKCHFDVPF